jgi:hypothetical protein
VGSAGLGWTGLRGVRLGLVATLTALGWDLLGRSGLGSVELCWAVLCLGLA